jgi:type II secretory pathway component HofQ
MRKLSLAFVLAAAVVLPSAAAPRPALTAQQRPAAHSKLISIDFVNADLKYVLKTLGRKMGRNLYLGPGVEGSVTVTLKDVPVDGAVALILKMQSKQLAYKLLGYDTLIVATPEKIAQVEDGILSTQLHR